MKFDVPRIKADVATVEQSDVLIGTCRCGARWSGEATAHCPTCHLTFGSVSGFDDHRDRRGEGTCRSPDELRMRGMEPDDNDHWRKPMSAAAKARIGGTS